MCRGESGIKPNLLYPWPEQWVVWHRVAMGSEAFGISAQKTQAAHQHVPDVCCV